MNNNIGENIKLLRIAKNMTQFELAEIVGITKGTISSYENCTRLPSYEILIKTAHLFRVSTDNLFGYSNKYTLDVTHLNARQRNIVQEIVFLYESQNERIIEALAPKGRGDITTITYAYANEFDIEEYKKNK